MLQYLDAAIVVIWWSFVVLGSLAMLVRMTSGKRSLPGQPGALPERCARWLLGEDAKSAHGDRRR